MNEKKKYNCQCKGYKPKANWVHTAATCYKYPQDEDTPTPQPECKHGPDWKRDGYCALCKRQTQPELSKCCGAEIKKCSGCFNVVCGGKNGYCSKCKRPFEPVKEEGKVTMKRIECEGVGDNNGFYEMTFTPPQDEDWAKDFLESTSAKVLTPLQRQVMIVYIRTLINKEREEAYDEGYEERRATEPIDFCNAEIARQDAFKECLETIYSITTAVKDPICLSGAKTARREIIDAITSLSQKSHE